MIIDYINFVFKDIKARKFSSFLTFFAISLGILSIFVIILVSQGFEQSIEKQFEQLGVNRLIISYDGSQLATLSFNKGLTDTEVDLVGNKPYITEVWPYYLDVAQIKYGNEYVQKQIFGVVMNEDYFTDFNAEIEFGRYPKNNDKFVVVIGPEFAQNQFQKEVRVGSNIYIKDTKFKVIGILKSIGNPEDDKNAYFPIDTIRDLYDSSEQVHFIYATVNENYDINLAASNIEILLENKLGKDTVNVMTLEQMMEQLDSILVIVKMTLGGIALVSLVVGAFGIINTMFVIITEKTKDIGVMKAVGATNSNIFFIYVFEAGSFGFLGGILGVMGGSFVALAFGSWAQANGYTFLEITISPVLVIMLLSFSFFMGAFSGFVPAYKASKLKIVDTFRK